MAGFTAADAFIDTFFFWLPLVGFVKVIFIIWLVMPGINGTEMIYDHIVEPYLIKNEDKLDRYFYQARAVAQKSSHNMAKHAYDGWIGYMQKIVTGQQDSQISSSASQTTPVPESQDAGEESAAIGSTRYSGLTALLNSVTQKVPTVAATAVTTTASYLAGSAGVTDGPQTQADQVGRSPISSFFSTLVMGFTSPTLSEIPEDQRLRDIRSRKAQLQGLVAQLEHSEKAILSKQTETRDTSETQTSCEDRFESDAVIVSGSSADTSSSESHIRSRTPTKDTEEDKAANPANKSEKSTKESSKRWFW